MVRNAPNNIWHHVSRKDVAVSTSCVPELSLSVCLADVPEDGLLVDWFKLIHEKHMLVRRESELIYM